MDDGLRRVVGVVALVVIGVGVMVVVLGFVFLFLVGFFGRRRRRRRRRSERQLVTGLQFSVFSGQFNAGRRLTTDN